MVVEMTLFTVAVAFESLLNKLTEVRLFESEPLPFLHVDRWLFIELDDLLLWGVPRLLRKAFPTARIGGDGHPFGACDGQ